MSVTAAWNKINKIHNSILQSANGEPMNDVRYQGGLRDLAKESHLLDPESAA
ncbi:MAG: hypothetical protein OEQ39_21605 [Gammaproteobacteria bacterium]|nr:hypothetical protein [Gammaproteobacteria bacterium]